LVNDSDPEDNSGSARPAEPLHHQRLAGRREAVDGRHRVIGVGVAELEQEPHPAQAVAIEPLSPAWVLVS
jgi:hypothetical protein